VIYVTGEIVIGDAGKFAQLETTPPKLVVLDSPGGEVDNAIAMAKLIRDVGIPPLIPADKECLSACVMLFFAGSQRFMGAEASSAFITLGTRRAAIQAARLLWPTTSLKLPQLH
jgi:hypothetical protein